MLEKPAYYMFKNDVDWAPKSLHLGHDKLGPGKGENQQERDRRTETRKRNREETEQEIMDTTDMDVENDLEIDDDGMWDKETQTVSTGELVIDFFDEEEFVKDDQKVKYYTGLSNGELLMEVFKLVVPFPGNKKE